MKLRFFLLMILAMLCAGCVNDGHYYSRNPDFRWYPDEAVMLLGVVGRYDFNVIKGHNADGKRYSLVIFPRDHDEDFVDVYAIAFPKGESVSINYVQFEPKPDNNPVRSEIPYFSIDDPRLVKFDSNGIFYYGTVVSGEKGVGMTDEYRDQMIALAKKKYPSLFDGFDPREIIFQ